MHAPLPIRLLARALSRAGITTLLLAGLILAPSAGRAAEPAQNAARTEETTELWSGTVLSATFRAGICTRRDGAVRGVFLLTHKSGDTDVYHIYGSRVDGEVQARHASGHVFRARVDGNGALTGTVRIKNRIKLTMKGTSRSGVPLSDDCAPLQ
ncbi:MAG: hypothetical protein Q4F72_10130 [Desulfovibrionaceae bacterium]|nr:hypothetical protein [Desulfovibrionaceae bacterium]